MLIVVAIIATLMGMVFRLGSIGSDSDRRNRTVVRLQKLENCLSGYYAAFGSYPPVRLHGSRSPYREVSSHGIQRDSDGGVPGDEHRAWNQVQAACRSQPVACNFPFPAGYDNLIKAVSDGIAERISEDADGYTEQDLGADRRAVLSAGFHAAEADTFGSNKNEPDWRKIQLFRFGLMSFLLPRYLVMMNGDRDFYRDGNFAQWSENNVIPSDPYTGRPFTDWNQMKEYGESLNKSDVARLANIPSQAVCARWMPNLEKICHTEHSFTLFGINISTGEAGSLRVDNTGIEIFSPRGADSNSTADQYVLDGVTVQDGWWRDFYYYSPSPYQTYTLWSAGPDGRTFPPWIARDKIADRRLKEWAAKWSADDIIHMSH